MPCCALLSLRTWLVMLIRRGCDTGVKGRSVEVMAIDCKCPVWCCRCDCDEDLMLQSSSDNFL